MNSVLSIIAFVFFSSINSYGMSADSLHLFGRGIVDSKTKNSLTLACSDSQGCTEIRWLLTVAGDKDYFLGDSYHIPRSAQNEEDAILRLELPYYQDFSDLYNFYDLENDPFANNAIKNYISGVAANTRKNYKEEMRDLQSKNIPLFSSTSKIYSGSKDITSSYMAIKKQTNLNDSQMKEIGNKSGWNWSSEPKLVNHSRFGEMVLFVLKRALENEQALHINGPRTIANYIEIIKNEKQAKAMVGAIGINTDHEFDHFTNGDEILKILLKLNL